MEIYFIFGPKFSWNEGINTCFNVKCMLLACNFDLHGVDLVVAARYLVVTAGFCSLPGGYWWLLLVIARYYSFPLLVWTELSGLYWKIDSVEENAEWFRPSCCTSTTLCEKYTNTELFLVRISLYGVVSGPYFPVFGLNTRKHEPEIIPYLDNFNVVQWGLNCFQSYVKICAHASAKH